MVRRGASSLKKSRDAKRRRQAESEAERDARLEEQRQRDAQRRHAETEAERDARLEEQRQRDAQRRHAETEAERAARLEEQRQRNAQRRDAETEAEWAARLEEQRQRDAQRREAETEAEWAARLEADRIRCRGAVVSRSDTQQQGTETIVPFEQLQVIPIVGDGNCFFYAVCDQLRGTPLETDAASLRQDLSCRVAELMPQLIADGLIAPESADEIVNSSFQAGIYVSDEVASLLSRCFDVDLVIYQANGSVMQYFRANLRPPNAIVRVLLRHEHYESLRLRELLQAFTDAEFPSLAASRTPAKRAKKAKGPSAMPAEHETAGRAEDGPATARPETMARPEAPAYDCGPMDWACNHCGAKLFRMETGNFCCAGGKVKLPTRTVPQLLADLYMGRHGMSSEFLTNIRSYNSVLHLTSLSAKPRLVPGWNPSYIISGQLHHTAMPLFAEASAVPRGWQVYFTDRELESQQSLSDRVKPELHELLQTLLHECNLYVRSLKAAAQRIMEDPELVDARIVIHPDRRPSGEHIRRYNLPTANEVGILIVKDTEDTEAPEDGDEPATSRDVVIQLRGGGYKRISKTHRSYDALEYVLLFPHGEDGWHPELRMSNGRKLTPMKYYASEIMVRAGHSSLLHHGRRLFQQYLVDMCAKIESERLLYLRTHQSDLRSETYSGLRDALFAADGRSTDTNPTDIGKPAHVFLSSSFVGGPRYLMERLQDAMTYVQKFGKPDLFVTATCNPKWPEISAQLLPGQRPEDRPDIVTRVFELKKKALLAELRKRFGKEAAHVCSLEYQKRGLPHVHFLLWLVSGQRVTPDRYDKIVSAEIPDPQQQPRLHELVKTHMIHGPCGVVNPACPCMVDGQCSKGFPKEFQQATLTSDTGYPLYRRLSPEMGGFTVDKLFKGRSIRMDNRSVVPYNPGLLLLFECHMNFEVCATVKSVKYVIKYLLKGGDMASFKFEANKKPSGPGEQAADGERQEGSASKAPTQAKKEGRNEIKEYLLARYIGPMEAVNTILGFEVHNRFPAVIRLCVHKSNEQLVYFNEQNASTKARAPRDSTLTAFFKLCRTDEFARGLVYTEVPSYFVWHHSEREWRRAKKGSRVEGHPGVVHNTNIARMYTVSPRAGDLFYMRMLLLQVRGPTSFEALHTVDGVLCPSAKAACTALGLLQRDDHWRRCLAEAVQSRMPRALRHLLAVILIWGNPEDGSDLWCTFAEDLCEDLRFHHRDLSAEEITDLALRELQSMLTSMGGHSLPEYGLPAAPCRLKSDRCSSTRLNRPRSGKRDCQC
ncbi:hypothetical protein BOX15_Mlig031738g1 [Macrostomum lignano]|uniref:OTU domain-containing protein n=1 Tax=Macrostomum lignano TaxID=282301 RepID=A0A267EKI4_9PLAT|nr:hypothetical protein BOX15_Mlig031738g1 [Macrostomum lignano]